MVNVLLKADLTHLMEHRAGLLHWVMQLDKQDPNAEFLACIARPVRPWDEWLLIFFPAPGFDPRTKRFSNEEWAGRVKTVIGDDTPVTIQRVSTWLVNETFAESYGKGNV